MRRVIKIIATALAVFTAFAMYSCNKDRQLHEHTYSDYWEHDDTYHWKLPTCGDTDEPGYKSVHNFIGDVCHLCGYSRSEAVLPEYVNVEYLTDGEGTISGVSSQRVKRGETTSPVTAVPGKGFLFRMWDDGEIDATRQDAVYEDKTFTAIFMPDPDNPDLDDDPVLGDDHPDEPSNEFEKGESNSADGLIFTEMKAVVDQTVTGYSVRRDPKDGRVDYIVPETFNELPVLEIENNAFENSNVRSIQIPGSVIKIGHQSFMGCSSIKEINIPDSVVDLGSQAFQYCSSLQKVKLSQKMPGVWYKSFMYCSSLTEIEFPDSIVEIGRYAFYGCTMLKKVTIGKGIQRSGEYSFDRCTNLQEVHVGDLKAWAETKFDSSPFNLNSTFGSNPLAYAHKLYHDGELVEDLVIPEGTAIINNYAFMDCTSIKKLHVPGSVKIIKKMAFVDCSELTNAIFEEGVLKIEYNVFLRCNKLEEVSFPDTLESLAIDVDALEHLYHNVFESCDNLKKVTLGTGMKEINGTIFMACYGLSEIDFRGTSQEWIQLTKLAHVWATQCMDPLTVHCHGDKKDVVYREKWVVDGYIRYPAYDNGTIRDMDAEVK